MGGPPSHLISTKSHRFHLQIPPHCGRGRGFAMTSGGTQTSICCTRAGHCSAQVSPVVASKRPNILTPATRPYIHLWGRHGLQGSTQEIREGISWWSQGLVGGWGGQVALHSRRSCQIYPLSDSPTGQKPSKTSWSLQPHLGRSTKALFM